jgi:hypothetical protein
VRMHRLCAFPSRECALGSGNGLLSYEGFGGTVCGGFGVAAGTYIPGSAVAGRGYTSAQIAAGATRFHESLTPNETNSF